MKEPRQTTDSVLMIRPYSFRFNEQTAVSNAFQKPPGTLSADEIGRQAQAEFDNLAQVLRDRDINVYVVEDTPAPPKPDAIFPNNWVSFHPDGTVFLYPMLSPNRSAERRLDVVENLKRHFHIRRIVDLAAGENRVLEGTGSMVCDYVNRIVYACLSPRTDRDLLDEFAARIGCKPLAFVCLDEAGAEIYHTNVVMCVGEKLAVVCLDTIRNPAERKSVIEALEATNHEVIEISVAQMNRFAGNMLEVRSNQGVNYLVMSASARAALDANQISKIERRARILSADIKTIEAVGGGSVRCMMAGIFCEKK